MVAAGLGNSEIRSGKFGNNDVQLPQKIMTFSSHRGNRLPSLNFFASKKIDDGKTAACWDLLFNLDGAWRLYTGQVLQADFTTRSARCRLQ